MGDQELTEPKGLEAASGRRGGLRSASYSRGTGHSGRRSGGRRNGGGLRDNDCRRDGSCGSQCRRRSDVPRAKGAGFWGMAVFTQVPENVVSVAGLMKKKRDVSITLGLHFV